MAAALQGASVVSCGAVRGFSETRDFRIATLGNVDSGKSTLVGCLTRNIADDGRGSARAFVLRHQHEKSRGQSSSVAMTLLGFRDDEQVLPAAGPGRGTHNKDSFEVASKATHRLQLVDLCGHQRYLKSSIYGLTAMSPDAALVVVGAERGIQRMTREHVGLACALRIPFIVVMTKVDMAPPDVLKESQMMLKRLLNRAGRKAFMVREAADVEGALKCMDTGQTAFAPVFEVSCVTGQNMDNLRLFVRRLTVSRAQLVYPLEEERKEDVASGRDESEVRDNCDGDDEARCSDKLHKMRISPIAQAGDGADAAQLVPAGPLNVLIDDSFAPPGVGVVIGGTVRQGGACVGQRLFVGPSKNGEWIAVSVKSIFRQCVPSKAAYCGQHATFALKSLNSKVALRRDMFRKGMVAVNEASLEAAKRQTVFEFGAVVRVLHHATTIEKGYSPFIHVAGARESAKIMEIRDIKTNEETTARTGSEVFIRFRFLYYAQYLELSCPLIFREGDAKGCGRVTALFDADGNQIESAK